MAITISNATLLSSGTSVLAATSPYSNDTVVAVVDDGILLPPLTSSSIIVVSILCGPSTTANFTFACSAPRRSSSAHQESAFRMSNAAERRINETLRWFEENVLIYQRGKRCAASGTTLPPSAGSVFSTRSLHGEAQLEASAVTVVCDGDGCIRPAVSVVFATMEEGVGEGVHTSFLVTHFIAPYFLDTRRVVSRGEFLLLPFRGGGRASLEDASTPPRLFWVSAVTPSQHSPVPMVNAMVHELVVEIGEETCVDVMEVCRGPIYTHAVRLHPSPDDHHCVVADNLDQNETTIERSPAPHQPAAAFATTPTHEPSALKASSDNGAAPSETSSQLDREREAAAGASRRAHARDKAIQEMIRSFYTRQAKWDDEQIFTAAMGEAFQLHHRCSKDGISERDVESWTLRQIRHQYRLASQLRDHHNDISRYLQDVAAHPSRGNVLRLELTVSLRTHSFPTYDNDVLDTLKHACREKLGAVATCGFLTSDEHVAYVTVALSCMPALEDHFQRSPDSSQLLIDVAYDEVGGDNQRSENRSTAPWSLCTKTWAATLLPTTIIEDLCRRRERARQMLINKTNDGRHLSAIKDVVLGRLQVLQDMYQSFCSQSNIPLMSLAPSPSTSQQHSDDTTTDSSVQAEWWRMATDRLRDQLLQVDSILAPITAALTMDAASIASSDAVTLRDLLFPSLQLTMDDASTIVHSDEPRSATMSFQLLAAQSLRSLDDAYRPVRNILVAAADGSSSLSAVRSQLVEDAQAACNRAAVARHMHDRLTSYAAVFAPYLQVFIPVVLPTITMSTDHRASRELLHFLTASNKAQSDRASVLSVESECEAFLALRASLPSAIPHIPPFQLNIV
jgi:hypothetical protein